MLKQTIIALSVAVGLFSCQSENKNNNLQPGSYTLSMDLGSVQLDIPVTYGTQKLTIHNGAESIHVPLSVSYDSIYARFPVFDAGLALQSKADTLAEGAYIKYYKDNYRIPVRIHPPSKKVVLDEAPNYTEAYQVTFSPNSEDAYPAKGLFSFRQDGSAYGTFTTETGDYRYLFGHHSDSTFQLNTFDGSHAFVFTGKLKNDSIVAGMFYSGTHWKEPWVGVRNADYELTAPDSLSKVNNPVTFSFLNTDSTLFTFNEESYKDTAVIIQILGSWCPNCLDETQFLSQLQKDYEDQPLQIIGIAFESKTDFNYYQKQIARLKEKTGISYPVLLGGKASKQLASDTLTFVDEIKSFPTTIFLDKNHEVRRIHTGFYGPGTGDYYTRFSEKTYLLLDKIFGQE